MHLQIYLQELMQWVLILKESDIKLSQMIYSIIVLLLGKI